MQSLGHMGKGFLQILHFAGLEQIAADPQADGLLGIVEIPEGGEHRHLEVGELALQRGDHVQAVHVGHADIRQHDLGTDVADQPQPFHAVRGGAHHLAIEFLPGENLHQPLQNDFLIVHQHHAKHVQALLHASFVWAMPGAFYLLVEAPKGSRAMTSSHKAAASMLPSATLGMHANQWARAAGSMAS